MTTVLRIVGIARSTYYYQTRYAVKEKQGSGGRAAPGYSWTDKGEKVADEQISEWLMEMIAGSGSAYGYRKLTVLLRREYHLVINHKKVYRLCKRLDILRPQRQKRVKHPRRIARNRTVTASNQLWQTDIKYGYIAGEDRFFFVMPVLDVFDRSVVAYHMGPACTSGDAAATLRRALWRRELTTGDKLVIRTDNGPQFVARAFGDAIEDLGCEHERIPPKTPNKNAHIEAFHRILEDECLSQSELESFEEACLAVTAFIRFYNRERIHGSLGYQSPAWFYEAQRNQPEGIHTVHL
ncbi:IS3 family transposase [Paludifilum halophilum]|uniref:Integrase catalytic domain-containing protein n=1 Tax=Paludifilum halophilum TaxID=1642702 RepID=A0A235B376_9BACL|nr:IS3 family transposase [Paludifilum halophilum]OYD06075.1 hypothetical protein CHM34_18245 [Paludifilum halophilum]